MPVVDAEACRRLAKGSAQRASKPIAASISVTGTMAVWRGNSRPARQR